MKNSNDELHRRLQENPDLNVRIDDCLNSENEGDGVEDENEENSDEMTDEIKPYIEMVKR